MADLNQNGGGQQAAFDYDKLALAEILENP